MSVSAAQTPETVSETHVTGFYWQPEDSVPIVPVNRLQVNQKCGLFFKMHVILLDLCGKEQQKGGNSQRQHYLNAQVLTLWVVVDLYFRMNGTGLNGSISSVGFPKLSEFTVSPCRRWAPGDAHTWRTGRCPSRSPSHHGLHQRWRHSARLWRPTITEHLQLPPLRTTFLSHRQRRLRWKPPQSSGGRGLIIA